MSTEAATPSEDAAQVPVGETNGSTSEADLLASIMQNSPFTDDVDPLPGAEVPSLDSSDDEEGLIDPEELTEEVDEVEEVESDEDTPEEDADESEEDESATDESEVYAPDDLDLDLQVEVTIDGEKTPVSMGEIIKGYQTEKHLSKKGRELGEARKKHDEEVGQAMSQLETLGSLAIQEMSSKEDTFSKAYHKTEQMIAAARKDGDKYKVDELKDKREEYQKAYWTAKNAREAKLAEAMAHHGQLQQQTQAKATERFMSEVVELIPGFTESDGEALADFAIGEGLPAEVIPHIQFAPIIKMFNDYKNMKQGVSKGAVKRKKSVVNVASTKKSTPAATKKASKDKMIKARAFKDGASKEDHMDFLKSHAKRSLGG